MRLGTNEDFKAVCDHLHDAGIKVVLENEVRRDLNLLAEGHAAILERLPSQEEKEALEARMDAMEAAIRLHSKQIRELKKAQ